MAERASKVIGYFAYLSPEQVVCTGGQACVIAGSEQAMRSYAEEIHPGDAHKARMKKTRFGEILQGLTLGAAYAFDEDAYRRFYPLGRAEGLPLAEGDFVAERQRGNRFFTVQLDIQE